MRPNLQRPRLGALFTTPAFGKSFAIVVAILPGVLFAFLSIVNAEYMSHFFAPQVMAVGLPMLGLVVLLSVLSYILLRRCSAIIASGKRLPGVLLATLVMAMVQFPAVLLVVLGPAALMLLDASR